MQLHGAVQGSKGRRGSKIFEREGGGGPGTDTRFFTSTPPPWTLLRKFEKHPTLGHSQKGGSNFGPNVKKPTSWPKRGGPDPLDPPPPPLDPPLKGHALHISLKSREKGRLLAKRALWLFPQLPGQLPPPPR